jgi:hypothetical protein
VAKRLDSEKPYTPLDSSVISTVLSSQPATNSAATQPTPPRPASNTSVERMDAMLRLKVAMRDKREFEAFTARLGVTLNTTLRPSNLIRAMLSVMQNAETELAELARREPPLRRPPNDDLVGYADFESRVVRLLDAAVRRSAPVRQ